MVEAGPSSKKTEKLTGLLEGGGEDVAVAVEGISFPLERKKLLRVGLPGLPLEPKLRKQRVGLLELALAFFEGGSMKPSSL
jgi:hypothetical protein